MAARLDVDLRVFPNGEAASLALASAVASLVHEAVEQRGRFTIALSGGETPRRLYTILAQDYRNRVPWQGVHVFWGDERFVSPEHPLSNYRMAREALLDNITLPPQNIHPVPTTAATPEEAARAYEAELLRWFGSCPPSFDLTLLGLGADGHIASLFPGSGALCGAGRAAVAVRDVPSGPARLTLTFPVFNSAAHIYFLVLGKGKAKALEQTLASDGDISLCPARGIRPTKRNVVFWADMEAASLIRTVPS